MCAVAKTLTAFGRQLINKLVAPVRSLGKVYTSHLIVAMESFNLKTASTYINNLLLARGLLRNGAQIEFARPSKGEGGTEATLAHIINLVHDLILRRDVSTKTVFFMCSFC